MRQQILFSDAAISDEVILDLYLYQYNNNDVFRSYCDLMNRKPSDVTDISDCAYLPISFFKSHEIKTGAWQSTHIFKSSTTSGGLPSQHLIRQIGDYQDNAVRCFNSAYGDVTQYSFLTLLPSYLEQGNSSLVDMVGHFINLSNYAHSQFYLSDLKKLSIQLIKNIKKKIPTILWGVSYALLDFAELYPMDLSEVIIMETGGMKGRRKEISKKELHKILGGAFNVSSIHSEYGMTELLSQSYSYGHGLFDICRPQRVSITATDDPMQKLDRGKRGRIQIIDMANIDSCAFIATDDMGILRAGGQLEILGRLDGSEQRGCNLMVGG